MTAKTIISYPDPRLKLVSQEVSTFDKETHALMNDLRDSMAASRIPGAGLAAIQIGVPKRALIADVQKNRYGEGIVEFINPVILEKKGAISSTEGCLSVPEVWADVSRYREILLQYKNRNGIETIEIYTDICAIVIQHEMDHLAGILFIDRISQLKKNRAIKKLTKNLVASRQKHQTTGMQYKPNQIL